MFGFDWYLQFMLIRCFWKRNLKEIVVLTLDRIEANCNVPLSAYSRYKKTVNIVY